MQLAAQTSGEADPTPNIVEALAAAVRCHQGGDLRWAAKIYRLVLREDPANASAWRLLGMAAHHAGRKGEAVTTIGRAIALDGGQAVFHSNFGLAYAALRRADEALACCREALRLRPDSVETHNNLGTAGDRAGLPGRDAREDPRGERGALRACRGGGGAARFFREAARDPG